MGMKSAGMLGERGQLLEHRKLMPGEAPGKRGKQFENAVDILASEKRQHDDRPHAQSLADFRIDQGMAGGIGAILSRAGTKTLAGDAGMRIQAGTERRRGDAGAGTADHFAVFPHGNGHARGAGNKEGGVGEGSEDRIQGVFAGIDHFLQRIEDGDLLTLKGGKGSGRICGVVLVAGKQVRRRNRC